MTTFKYSAERFSELRKKIIVKSLSVLIPAMVVGLYIGLSGQQPENSRIDVLPIVISVIIALLAASFGLSRGIKKTKGAVCFMPVDHR